MGIPESARFLIQPAGWPEASRRMAKRYSQDLRDRVIDAVERDKLSRRAAARHYEVSESVAIKWLERLERHGTREPVGHGGHRASKLMPHRDFLKGRAGRETRHHDSGSLRSLFGRAEGSKPTPR
jgi:transposase-like protein